MKNRSRELRRWLVALTIPLPSPNVAKYTAGEMLNLGKLEECSIPETKIYKRLKLRKLALKMQLIYFAAINIVSI